MAVTKRTLLIAFIVFLLWVAVYWVPNHSDTRIPRNESGAAHNVRTLNLAEHNYAAQYPNAGFVCSLCDLGELDLIDGALASGTKWGYHFEIQCPQDGSQKATRYTFTAVPMKPGTTGKAAFCTDQGGEIWYSKNGSAEECLAMRKAVKQ